MQFQLIKDNIYKITTVVVIALLVITQAVSWVKAEDPASDTGAGATVTAQSDADNENISEMDGLPNLPNIPNAKCLTNFYHWEGGSSTYNPNTPYNVLFVEHTSTGGTSSFQDINGDNLPDFIYIKSELNNSNENYYLHNAGCVYLNNGSGWDKVFVCNTNVTYNNTTGEVIQQRYQGDCAG